MADPLVALGDAIHFYDERNPTQWDDLDDAAKHAAVEAVLPTLYVVLIADVPFVFSNLLDSDTFAEHASMFTDDILTFELGKLDDLASSMRLIDEAYAVPR